jgi:hypothetical protein
LALIGPSEELQTDRDRLRQLREALHGAFHSLGHDKCGDWSLRGSRGHTYRDGSGWLLYVRWVRLRSLVLGQRTDHRSGQFVDRLDQQAKAGLDLFDPVVDPLFKPGGKFLEAAVKIGIALDLRFEDLLVPYQFQWVVHVSPRMRQSSNTSLPFETSVSPAATLPA